MTSHETTFRVRYAETDQMGVVYYANYLIWMELGRAEYCRAAGIRYKDMELNDDCAVSRGGRALPVYLSGALRRGITVRTWIARANRRMIEFSLRSA